MNVVQHCLILGDRINKELVEVSCGSIAERTVVDYTELRLLIQCGIYVYLGY